MFCGGCGRALEGQAYCRNCGAPAVTRPEASPAAADSPRAGGRALLIGGAVGLAVVLVAVSVWLVIGSGGSPDNDPRQASQVTTAGATPTPSTSPSPSPSPSASAKAAAAPSGPGDVRTLPAGLFCRDLHARGYSYTAAVEYWRLHGQPNQMDVERNGIPCETVYAASDVTAYWGPRPSAGYVYDSGFDSLPAGLMCRDLAARGLGYSEAVAYWGYWGQPDRMDEDLNGIPCETVYSPYDVNAYWLPG